MKAAASSGYQGPSMACSCHWFKSKNACVSLSLPGGRERTDLVVGAVAACLPGRLGVEMPGTDAGGGGLDRLDRLLRVLLGRHVPPHGVCLDEAQLHPLGEGPRHLPPGQRIDL